LGFQFSKKEEVIMKKSVLFIVLLAISLASTGISFAANVKLHLVYSASGDKFLADEKGVLLYSLEPPFISVNFDRNTIVIHPHVYYSPGAPYYDSFYDGFNIVCAGHPRSGIPEKMFYFGPLGGEFTAPATPYEYCGIEAWVADSDGVLFKTEANVIHYNRQVLRKR
jgi:hypothetical protein